MIRLLKITIIFIIILLFSFIIIKINNHKKSNNIEINYVNELNSELYNFIYLYDYNENTCQYECKKETMEKDNVLEYIFYYYNDNLIYDLETINIIDNTVYIKLKKNKNQKLERKIFKKMKLSYNSLLINKLIVSFNNEQYIF